LSHYITILVFVSEKEEREIEGGGGKEGGKEGGREGGREGCEYLDVGVNDELHQAKDLAGEVESISEARLLPLFGRQCFGGLQVEVVVQVQVWREGGKEGGREGGRAGGKEGRKEGGREVNDIYVFPTCVSVACPSFATLSFPPSLPPSLPPSCYYYSQFRFFR